MKAKRAIAKDIDDYIAGFPSPVQKLLQTMRATIRKAVAGAGEKISYQIPTFTLHGNLVHFAAFKNHIGFYPGAAAIRKFKPRLSAHKSAKGSVQFQLDEPIPWDLITDIVKFRVEASRQAARARVTKRPRRR